MKILDKYIATELVGPFVFGISTFTLLFMSVDLLFRIASLIVQGQITFFDGILCILYNLPSILVFTFPMGILLAVLIAFGRLSGESEIIAMKSSGISFYRIAAPAIVAAAAITLFSFFINETISPEYTYRARNIVIKALTKEGAKMRENIYLQSTTPDGLERITTARKFDYKTGQMLGVMIQDYKNTMPVRWVYAERAHWDGSSWWLEDGDVYNLAIDNSGDIKYKTHFARIEIPIPYTPLDIENRERAPEEMSSRQIKKNAADLEKIAGQNKAPDKELLKKINTFKVLYYQKLSLPFTCFVFALFGIPLGIRPHRTSTSFGLGLSIVFIFIYYILMAGGKALGENLILPPIAAAWLPNIAFAVMGAVLLYKKGQH